MSLRRGPLHCSDDIQALPSKACKEDCVFEFISDYATGYTGSWLWQVHISVRIHPHN